MITNIKKYLYEPKSKIGWVHGLSTCFGAFICAYLSMMIFSYLAQGDYAHRIIPSIIITPVLMSSYGLYFLFTQKPIDLLKKIFIISMLLISILIITIKVF